MRSAVSLMITCSGLGHCIRAAEWEAGGITAGLQSTRAIGSLDCVEWIVRRGSHRSANRLERCVDGLVSTQSRSQVLTVSRGIRA
jgi:hypothetical protein